MEYKPYIGVDLDGTLAKQYWPHDGEFHPLRIGDPIIPMVERVKKMLEEGRTVKIFTARVGPVGNSPYNKGLKKADVQRAIFEWTEKYIGVGLEATSVKDYCMVELWDDRSVRIIHNTGARCCDE